MNNSPRFILERYRSGGHNRYVCPNCKRAKCFTRYIDVETGEYVADECGKCNHDNSCHYHYPPRLYFHDHPEPQAGSINLSSTVRRLQPSVVFQPTDVPQTEFYDLAWAERSRQRGSTFRTWFEQLPFPQERIRQVLHDYYLGATTDDVRIHGLNYGPAAVFWQIDERGRVHDAKMIAYTSDGHRVEGWGNSLRALCEKRHQGPQLQQTEKVLYGLHLLTLHPDATVALVESEKTALVCACCYPHYLWLATGGCGNLQVSKLRPLMQRSLLVFPDSGEYQRWQRRMEESGHRDYHVSDALEAYPPNTDLADLILDSLTPKPPSDL